MLTREYSIFFLGKRRALDRGIFGIKCTILQFGLGFGLGLGPGLGLFSSKK